MSNIISLEDYRKRIEYSIEEIDSFEEYITYRITQGDNSYDITINTSEFLNS